ncbi:transporter [Cytophagaceae bacterium ABcell3]|nr:transporter [Cytophagaceae bacterium ABcell3]
MKLLLALLFTIFLSSTALGQDTTITITKEQYQELVDRNVLPKPELEPIATDRPHQTETAQIVPSGYFQIESGFSVERDYTGINREYSIGYNDLLLKYGLGHNIDLRVGSSFVNHRMPDLGENIVGLTGILVGGKKMLYSGNGWIPVATLMTELFLPSLGHPAFRPPFSGGTVRLLFENQITDRIELEYNFGPHWTGYTPNASYFYAISLTYQLWRGLSIYGESYGFFIEHPVQRRHHQGLIPDIRIDGGFVYLVNDNLQLDIEAGVGLSEISPDGFVALGFSWRFPH